MDRWELLTLLKTESDKNEYVSGEDISGKFGVTRAAVWKNINELKSLGYDIISKTNNGYKLTPPFDILNAHELEYKFSKKNLPYQVIYKTSVDSTNNEAKKIPHSSGNIVVAASGQTGGRGRYNRAFLSKQDVGIYFTLKILPSADKPISIKDITFYPLVAALAVCRTAKEMCGIDLKIKWPNDLMYGEKKICGILTEASIEAENRNVAYVIVGTGVNVNNRPEDFPDELSNIATSLKIISGKKYDRADILCEVVENFTALSLLPRSEMLIEYRQHLITGRKVSFSQDNTSYVGTASDINEDGNLIVRLDDDTDMIIQSGEIIFIKT